MENTRTPPCWSISFTEEEKIDIANAAGRHGKGVSDWVREIVLNETARSKRLADQAEWHATYFAFLESERERKKDPAVQARKREVEDWRKRSAGQQVMRTGEVAKLLRISNPSVLKLYKNGTIRAFNSGGVAWFCTRKDIDALFGS
ncbi:MAG: helix-turn-helix domain-containing protein [Janthinobacterium lividum]